MHTCYFNFKRVIIMCLVPINENNEHLQLTNQNFSELHTLHLYIYRLGIQPVLINEINLNENPHCGMQFIHERTSAPALGFSKQSPHIAKCFGLYMNSKVREHQFYYL